MLHFVYCLSKRQKALLLFLLHNLHFFSVAYFTKQQQTMSPPLPSISFSSEENCCSPKLVVGEVLPGATVVNRQAVVTAIIVGAGQRGNNYGSFSKDFHLLSKLLELQNQRQTGETQ
eukprot:GHVS01053762.1.p1 GENE.GHVS01053762.1~~GHVS01053762.1.p1  ORF type:complete len:117 (-),score=24.92 GHVS01053762.1:392-742(-)